MELDGEGGDGAVGGVGECCRRRCCCTITKRIRTAPNPSPSPIAQACTPTPKPKHDGFLEQHVLSHQPPPSSVHITAHGCTWPVATVLWTAPHLHKEPTRLQAHHPPLPLSIYLSSLFPQETHSRQWHIRQGFTSAARIDKLLLPSRPDLSLSRTITSPHAAHQQKHLCFVFLPPALSHQTDSLQTYYVGGWKDGGGELRRERASLSALALIIQLRRKHVTWQRLWISAVTKGVGSCSISANTILFIK